MKVTPLDIRRKEFRRAVRGYLDEDVDVFLDTVADEVERVSKLNTELQQKVRELEEQVSGHTHIREALEKTLVAAQLQSDEIRSRAKNESQSMLRDAEAKAKAVVDEFYARTRAVQQTLIQLKLLEEDFRFKFKGLLEGYMKLLDDGPIELSAPEVEVVASETEKKGESEIGAMVSRDERPPEVDDSPTSETTEALSLLADETVTPAARQPRPAPLPPHLPKVKPTSKTTDSAVDDRTVETGVAVDRDRGGNRTDPGVDGEAVEKEGGVYFGRSENDSDDPFPEIGGDPAKPRDFAW